MPDSILYNQALELLNTLAVAAGPVLTETVSLEAALGRVLAADYSSREKLPHFDNSAVDGFALRSADVETLQRSGPARFRILGTIVAGDLPPKTGSDWGCAWSIMTGAPFPPGFDCSVKIEDTEVIRDGTGRALEIVVTASVAKGANVRPAGEDFIPGKPALLAGTRLAPQHVMGAAALGLDELTVTRRPRIAIISTGKEVVPHDASAKPGQVRNSTLPYLRAATLQLGWDLVSTAAVGDESKDLHEALRAALAAGPDVVITTGGVSMGVHDHVSAVARDLGARVVFHRAAIRPGKPILVAQFAAPSAGAPSAGPVLFGLPGNPISTVVGLRFFVEPYLRARLGLPLEAPQRARLTAGSTKPRGLRCFFKARWTAADGQSRVTILHGQPSFMISPLLEMNAWAVLPEAGDSVHEGDWVDVYPIQATPDAAVGAPGPTGPGASHNDCCGEKDE